MWTIMTSCCLQDVPFLVVRLWLLIRCNVMSYTLVFFACKNLVIILMQTYRASTLVYDRYEKPSRDDDRRRLAAHYRRVLNTCREALDHLAEDEDSSHRRPPASPRRPAPFTQLTGAFERELYACKEYSVCRNAPT